MNETKVSCIVTTCKREVDIVKRAVESILNQTYKNIEIIVVDDSPSDYPEREKIKKYVEENNRPIVLIQHDKNQGSCVARNNGLKAAAGKYVAYLDDDDEWLPEKIEKQVQKIESSTAKLIYCGHIDLYEDTGKTIEKDTLFENGKVYEKLITNNFIGSTSFPLIEREALIAVGGFDHDMKSAQDIDTWLRISSIYDVDYVKEPLVIYHWHAGEQITRNIQNKIDGLELLYKKNEEYLNCHLKARSHRKIVVAPWYAKKGNVRDALSIWYSAVKDSPNEFFRNSRYFSKIIAFAILYTKTRIKGD